ncbi:MAG TPA: MlaD family protein [Rhodopila sp.]|nr:MlaD family protein [Rhodopila sp.]
MASAYVRPRKRIPVVWLVPIISALIGAWLAWNTYSKRGPTISISFQSAEGLQAGQSHLKFKDVDMGIVSNITVSSDLSRVIVTVETKRQADPLLTDKTVFWVVRPGLFAGRVSGLDTLLSGPYIQMLPSATPGEPRRDFVGQEDPPVLVTNEPGRTFLLRAERIGTVSPGSPIYFRDVDVGTVLGYDLGDMAQNVTIHAFVRKPFDSYIHDTTHFWNASGVSVNLGSSGISVQMESLKALLLGGIAFDSGGDKAEPVSAADHIFTLFASREEAEAVGFGHLIYLKSFFPGSVGGLTVGAPVTLHGLKIGQVTRVGLAYDSVSDEIVAPVEYRIEPGRIADIGEVTALPRGQIAEEMVRRGLRATLQASNLLTGQKLVALDFFPHADPAKLQKVGDVYIMPTAQSGGFDTIEQSAADLLNKVNQIDFVKIGNTITDLTAGLNTIVNGPQVRQALVSLNATLMSVHDLTGKLDKGLGPALKGLPDATKQLQETLTKANKLAGSLNDGYGDSSKFNRDLNQLLPQLTNAVRSIRALTDLLQRHPEALIRGRTDKGTE